MKRLTVMTAALMLLIAGQALAEVSNDDSAAMLANDQGLSLEGLRRDQTLLYDLPRPVAETPPEEDDSSKGILACHFTNGCGYVVNPQVMVDLQYRIAVPETSETAFARNNSPGDRLAPNVMVGVRYNF